MSRPDPVSHRLPWTTPHLTALAAAEESAAFTKAAEASENGTNFGPS